MKARKPVPATKGETWSLPPGIFLFMAVAAFYVWTATSSQYAFVWGTKKADHYNLLAEGFLKGHLYLAQDPPKELLALKDPLDPVANAKYRLHDASLYKGHYYVYFGPVPVLTLYLPWRVITGWSIPNNLAVILYLLAGYIFSCLLLFALLTACAIQPSWLQKRIVIAALGLCQTAPIILRRPFMYETAVAAGFCFAMAALYFFARYLLLPNARPWHAVAAGVSLGFTPGCRPNYVAFILAVGAGYLLFLWRTRGLRGRDLLRELYLFGIPVAVCGLLLAWYNYARFGNPFNIGQVYQLIGDLPDRGITTKASNLFPGLYRLLIELPVWVRHFPYVETATTGRFGSELWARGEGHVEPAVGLLVSSPICLVGIALPVVLYRFREQIPSPLRIVLLTIYAGAILNLLAIVMTVNRVTQRYEMDFAPELLVLSLFVLLFLHRGKATLALLAAGVALSAAITVALSINGYENDLIDRDADTFGRIARFLGDDDNTLRRSIYGLTLNGSILFHQQRPGKREALIGTGVPGRSNCIFIEYLDGGRIRFGAYMSGRGVAYGPDLPLRPDHPYVLSLMYPDVQSHLIIHLDDAVAFDAYILFFPTSFQDAAVLRNPNSMPPNVEPFSGELNAPQGLQFAAALAK
jgi:hypothetical protein